MSIANFNVTERVGTCMLDLSPGRHYRRLGRYSESVIAKNVECAKTHALASQQCASCESCRQNAVSEVCQTSFVGLAALNHRLRRYIHATTWKEPITEKQWKKLKNVAEVIKYFGLISWIVDSCKHMIRVEHLMLPRNLIIGLHPSQQISD